jgi:hypothetical protein
MKVWLVPPPSVVFALIGVAADPLVRIVAGGAEAWLYRAERAGEASPEERSLLHARPCSSTLGRQVVPSCQCVVYCCC